MMKALFTENYYRKQYKSFNKQKSTLNPEGELEYKMSAFNKEDYTEEAWNIIVSVMAKEVAEKMRQALLTDRETYENVRKNPACLGYINKSQEAKEAHRITTQFEFNCLKYKDFKESHCL